MLIESVEAAPAKVNLALHVVGRRADGYHSLESLVVFVDVADEVRIAPAAFAEFTLTGPFAEGLRAEETNLVTRAVAGFTERWPGRAPHPLKITLVKNLPIASGLGGGSADAAAALRAMSRLCDAPPTLAELSDLGLGLGADVPVCLLSRPAEMRGIGEIIHPLPTFPALHMVLVNPMQPVATGEVFRRLARRDNPAMPGLPSPMDRPAQLALWLEETRNDLEAPAVALVPEIGALIAELNAIDAVILARRSGSGATVFGLFASAAQAHDAAHHLRQRHPDYWVAAAPVIAAQ